MNSREFFTQMIDHGVYSYIFEQNTDSRVFRGPVERVSLFGNYVQLDLSFVNTTNDEGELIEWPITVAHLDIRRVTKCKIEGDTFTFEHPSMGQFTITPS